MKTTTGNFSVDASALAREPKIHNYYSGNINFDIVISDLFF